MADVHQFPKRDLDADATADLAAAVASRICHDLASPLGAVANGLELLALSGAPSSPELDLVTQSVTVANARLRFIRLAYGGSGDRPVSAGEVRDVLDGMSAGGRWTYDWQAGGPLPRAEVKVALLSMQCLETLLPHGGRITASRSPTAWTLAASGPKVVPPRHDWPVGDDGPIQFRLLARYLGDLGRSPAFDIGPAMATLRL